ncbi:phosphotransferase family protein [soil metagenome]
MAQDATTEALELVDHDALAAFLRGKVPDFTDLSVKLLAGGASNLTYLINLDDRQYVLRRRPLGPSAPRAHDMHREFRILDALKGKDLPIPETFAYYPDDDIVGAPFYVMDFKQGSVIHMPEDAEILGEAQANEASRSMIETLAKLHEIGPNDIDLENFGKPEDFLKRRINSWLRQWRSVEHRDFPQVEALGEVLLRDLPPQLSTTLVHGDYRLGNVILDVESPTSVKAILDWEMSTIGDPLTDLAHLLVYWAPTVKHVTHRAQTISQKPGYLSSAELSELYGSLTGRTMENLPFYLAFENWRAAIIKDAIYLRGTHGRSESDVTEEMQFLGSTVPLHLEEAAAILKDLGLIASPVDASQTV